MGIKELQKKKVTACTHELNYGCQHLLNMCRVAVTQYHILVLKEGSTIHHVTNTSIKHVPIEHLFSLQYLAQQLNGEVLDMAPAVDIGNVKCSV